MSEGQDLLGDLRQWFASRKIGLAERGFQVNFAESPSDRDKRSVSVTVASSQRIGRLVLWINGEAELSMGDVGSGAVTEEHREITSKIGLRDATETLVAWVSEMR
jgi:hypothetical protein